MRKLIVLGGGLSGLSAALNLSEHFEITVIEKEKTLGGLAASFEINNAVIPKFYHHVFIQDKITQKYLKLFGIDDLDWKKIKMDICVGGKKYSLTPLGLLNFKYLSLFGRLNYGLFGIYSLFLMNPESVPEKMGAESWLNRFCTKEVIEKIFRPLYEENKFNTSLSELSAKQLAYRLAEREALGKFGYPRRRLNSLINCFEEALEKKKVRILKGAEIKKIDFKKKVVTIGKKNLKFDLIINTIPAPEFLKIAKGLPKEYASQVSQVKYVPCVCVVFGTEEKLSNTYWTNFFGENVQMLIQHSNLFDGYACKVNYVLKYGGSLKDFVLSDEKIARKYFNALRKYFDFGVVWFKVFRQLYAEPIYDKHYSEYKPKYESSLPFLFNAGIAVTFPKIRTMNTALESGEVVANLIKQKYC